MTKPYERIARQERDTFRRGDAVQVGGFGTVFRVARGETRTGRLSVTSPDGRTVVFNTRMHDVRAAKIDEE